MQVPEHQIRTALEVFRCERNVTTYGRSSTDRDREQWDIVVFVLGQREWDLASTS